MVCLLCTYHASKNTTDMKARLGCVLEASMEHLMGVNGSIDPGSVVTAVRLIRVYVAYVVRVLCVYLS